MVDIAEFLDENGNVTVRREINFSSGRLHRDGIHLSKGIKVTGRMPLMCFETHRGASSG